jgi:hypothetical protein
MSQCPDGAAKVQEFHRQLFNSSVGKLRQEIKRITGVAVREAAAEVETASGTVVHAFTSGAMVQVFLLAEGLSAARWDPESGKRGVSGESSRQRSGERTRNQEGS